MACTSIFHVSNEAMWLGRRVWGSRAVVQVRTFVKSFQRYLLAAATVCNIYSSCVLLRGLQTMRSNTGICCKRLAGFEEGGLIGLVGVKRGYYGGILLNGAATHFLPFL